ncbi:hypothetical protein B0T21DRAFT_349401 [Apiosordaria backusii]|uniref:Uncharacterized protein n=1 Tax=Apiosordaria backusii TaxID=314023 RepID=A0AA40BDR1_9PEZI|nr:hypothetical protein B0T21DRAFT_349401 [Apiosordaria backusii]
MYLLGELTFHCSDKLSQVFPIFNILTVSYSSRTSPWFRLGVWHANVVVFATLQVRFHIRPGLYIRIYSFYLSYIYKVFKDSPYLNNIKLYFKKKIGFKEVKKKEKKDNKEDKEKSKEKSLEKLEKKKEKKEDNIVITFKAKGFIKLSLKILDIKIILIGKGIKLNSDTFNKVLVLSTLINYYLNLFIKTLLKTSIDLKKVLVNLYCNPLYSLKLDLIIRGLNTYYKLFISFKEFIKKENGRSYTAPNQLSEVAFNRVSLSEVLHRGFSNL